MKFRPGGPTRFAHQRRGLAKLLDTGGVTALLMEPGLGKTAVIIDYSCLIALKSPAGEARVLVVCPLAAVDTWVLQMHTFASEQVAWWAEAVGGSIRERGEILAARGGNPYHFTSPSAAREAPRAWGVSYARALAWREGPGRRRAMTASEGPDGLGTAQPRLLVEVVNIDTLASRARYGSKTLADHLAESIRRYRPDLVVVDESHKIKAADGNASRLLGRVAKDVPRRAILTGTVMPHSPLDVFGQWRFLDPYAFGRTAADGSRRVSTYGDFKARFAVMGGFLGREVTGYVNLDDMRAVMARNAIVVRKDEAADLPPTTDVVVPVELSPAEKRAYAEMKTQLATVLATGKLASVTSRLTQMLRLRQITSGYLPDDTGVGTQIGVSKAEVITSLVNDTLAGEARVVVFCLFSREIEVLARMLAVEHTDVLRIEGFTPVAERARMRARFGRPGGRRLILLAQIKTMSLAVNELVTASHAVFGSLSQQRDDLEQAKARLDRQGQTRPVTFWFALAPHTVDEVIMRAHAERTSLEAGLLAHIQADNQAKEQAR